MKFYQEDDLGIKRECYLISKYSFDSKPYLIYTDMVKGDHDEDFRLLVGQVINNKVNRVEGLVEYLILRDFRSKRDIVIDQLREEAL